MKPFPGAAYTVVNGDTIRNISRRAYGYDRADQVVDANPFIVSRAQKAGVKGISAEGLPIIFKNDVLQIPATTSRYDGRKVTADFNTQIMVKLDGIEYKGLKASGIKRGMNTIADGFTFEIPFDYRDAKLVDRVRPYSYKPAMLYIGGEPYITGICMKPSFAQSGGGGTVCTMEVRTKPGNMIECMAPHKSLTYENQTLLEIANHVAADYGAGRNSLKAYSSHGDSNKFASAVKEATETDFDFLKRLASQKGFLITSGKDGNLLFVRATADAKAVATLRQGQFPVLSCGSSFDGSKRFSEWRGYAQMSGVTTNINVQRDPGVAIFRPFAFTADESGDNPPDTTVGTKTVKAGEGDAEAQLKKALAGGGTIDMARAVRWRMCKSIADSALISVAVAGWHDPDGQLWEENTKVRFWAPAACIFKEADFIIKDVQLGKDTAGGDVAALALILPDAYNMTLPSTYPWSGYYADKGYKKTALESGERPQI
jgi:prophage tail gpP-like protein